MDHSGVTFSTEHERRITIAALVSDTGSMAKVPVGLARKPGPNPRCDVAVADLLAAVHRTLAPSLSASCVWQLVRRVNQSVDTKAPNLTGPSSYRITQRLETTLASMCDGGQVLNMRNFQRACEGGSVHAAQSAALSLMHQAFKRKDKVLPLAVDLAVQWAAEDDASLNARDATTVAAGVLFPPATRPEVAQLLHAGIAEAAHGFSGTRISRTGMSAKFFAADLTVRTPPPPRTPSTTNERR